MVSVVLLAVPLVPELVRRFGGVTASMVAESGAFGPLTPGGVFYANGRFWVFYSDGGNIVYSTSTDGATWTDPTVVREGNQGRAISVYFDGRYLHYGGGLFYRRGIPNSDGTITWVADEQGIPSPMGHPNISSIAVDSNGYVWIGFLDGPGYGADRWFYITRSGNNDGTWGETPEGFPYLLKVGHTGLIIPVPLSSGEVLVAYIDDLDGILRMQWWNGISWTERDVMDMGNYGGGFSAVARGNTAYIASQNGNDYWIYLFKYVSGTVTSERICRLTGVYPFLQLSIEPDTGILHIFYGGSDGVFRHIWGREGCWNGPEVWFNTHERIDGWVVSYSSPLCHVYSVPEFYIGPPYTHKIMFVYSPPSPPSPPPPPENRENIHWENMYLGGGSMTVSAFAYYFTSDRGCVLLVRAVCENGDPLPAGSKIKIDGEYLSQVEYDVWYKIYPAGTPPPSTVSVTFEIPGYISTSLALPVSVGGTIGDLQVFTVDEKGNPVPSLVEVRMNGALVGSQQSTGVATFRGLSAGKATVSGVSTGLLSPPPIEVDVAPNRMSTATLVFRRIYDPSITGKVSVTNIGAYPIVVTFDGIYTYTISPRGAICVELPAGNHYAVYRGTEPLLYEPQVITFTLEQGEEELQYLQVSPARDENWLREWMENARNGVGVGDLAVTVVDKASGTPIPGAVVYLDVGLQQTTNNSGLCYFKGVPTGDRKVKACAQGYFPTTATAKVSEGAATSVQVFLRGFLYEAKPSPPTGRYLILGFLAILLPGVVMWLYRRR